MHQACCAAACVQSRHRNTGAAYGATGWGLLVTLHGLLCCAVCVAGQQARQLQGLPQQQSSCKRCCSRQQAAVVVSCYSCARWLASAWCAELAPVVTLAPWAGWPWPR
jgi:hypothetical protein